MQMIRSLTMFVAVAQNMSFRKAAIDQGVSPQAVSKAVRQLETHLGLKLLHRSTRHLSLTEEGEHLFQHANPGMHMLNDALAGLEQSRQGMDGKIRLAAPLAFGNRVLMPLLAQFQALHPDIHFDLLLSDDFVDIVSLRIDIGFRTGLSPERNVISRKLGEIVSVVCAAPAYIEKFGMPTAIPELQMHRCTAFLHPQTGKELPWEILVNDEVDYIHVPSVARFNNIEAEIEAVKRGLGIGQLSEYLITQELASGALVSMLPEARVPRLGIYMYYAERIKIPVRVRRFIEFCMDKKLALH
ncbi:LysR family transcriptional regulator [Methylophilus luteus]|uniref:LysR family transcriptional regulator n=1 Tax=Methylophilus luteus TaxID=640108 RepID=A0ABW3F5I5_9PROT